MRPITVVVEVGGLVDLGDRSPITPGQGIALLRYIPKQRHQETSPLILGESGYRPLVPDTEIANDNQDFPSAAQRNIQSLAVRHEARALPV